MDQFNDDDFLLDGDSDDELLDDIVLDPTIHNLLEQDTLQWIFVGGKVSSMRLPTGMSLLAIMRWALGSPLTE